MLVGAEEDDGKAGDTQSAASGGEEYEPISDDELDEILADSTAQKREEQQEEEKVSGTSEQRPAVPALLSEPAVQPCPGPLHARTLPADLPAASYR